MLKKKCPSCAKKIGRKFSFCPHCGVSFRARQEKENFGMLGREDMRPLNEKKEVKLPFGMNKIVGSLIKQLEKQMGDLGPGAVGGNPKGFKIRISSGKPQVRQVVRREDVPQVAEEKMIISREENERRAGLPRVEVKSKVRRIGDQIIYELETSGIGSRGDVVISQLEQGIEVKAYSKDKCYVKIIPLKVEVTSYYVQKEKVFVELKG